jgi:opacity protein-like surface antigen
MLKKQLLLGSATVLAAMAAAAWPASAEGLYVSAYGGLNDTKDVNGLSGGGGIITAASTATLLFSGTVAGTTLAFFNFAAVTDFDLSRSKAETGWVLGAALGMDFGKLRGELEFSFRSNTLRGGVLNAVAQDTALATFVFPSTGLVVHPLGITVRPPGINDVFAGHPTFAGQVAAVSSVATFQANFSTNNHDRANGNVHTFTLMANVWYDFDHTDGWLKPYVGGGVGLARNRVQVGGGNILQGEEDNVAWQLGLGANVELDATTSLDIGYRYMDAGSVNVEVPLLAGGVATFDHEVQHQSLIAGLVFKLE